MTLWVKAAVVFGLLVAAIAGWYSFTAHLVETGRAEVRAELEKQRAEQIAMLAELEARAHDLETKLRSAQAERTRSTVVAANEAANLRKQKTDELAKRDTRVAAWLGDRVPDPVVAGLREHAEAASRPAGVDLPAAGAGSDDAEVDEWAGVEC